MSKTRYVPLVIPYPEQSDADSDKRHYSYECKTTAQERPYISRPSRTQQLQNPKLIPKLSTEVPGELLPTKGLADEVLAKREEERGRKKDHDEDTADRYGHSQKRERSISSHSAHSVSTISTTRSASASPARRGAQNGHDAKDQPTKPEKSRKRRYSDSSESYSGSSYSSDVKDRSGSQEWAEDRNIRRRRRESSPEERGRHRDSRRHRAHRRHPSTDKSQITKERRSMTPDTGHARSEPRSYRDREGPSSQPHASQASRSKRDSRARPDQPRERSPSPYSKRLALTQSIGN
ncbi:hypothetical protein N7478_007282 [Penicillium angulare]|uniref:uncharacterized protein n=1 Tax=Penicillium angulare TaxID=116970 RepID=UPI00253F8EA2|nr:uncharacterized protein N7478_007282 [Penicillium angulare]KAJ5281910.1 hypothetical protein N7478_007282 [Penicillium angulare]